MKKSTAILFIIMLTVFAIYNNNNQTFLELSLDY
jgi:hypothetical protein